MSNTYIRQGRRPYKLIACAFKKPSNTLVILQSPY